MSNLDSKYAEDWYDQMGIIARLKFEANPEAQYAQKEALQRIQAAARTDKDLAKRLSTLELHLVQGYPLDKLAQYMNLSEQEASEYLKTSIALIRAKMKELED